MFKSLSNNFRQLAPKNDCKIINKALRMFIKEVHAERNGMRHIRVVNKDSIREEMFKLSIELTQTQQEEFTIILAEFLFIGRI